MASKKKKLKAKNNKVKSNKKVELVPVIEQTLIVEENSGHLDKFYYVSQTNLTDFKKVFDADIDVRTLLKRALIAKDVQALKLIDKIYNITELDKNFNTIFLNISHIMNDPLKPENAKVINFLKTIKNIKFNGELISENELAKHREKTKLVQRKEFNMKNKSYLHNYDLYSSIVVNKKSIIPSDELDKIYQTDDFELGILYLFKLLHSDNPKDIDLSQIQKIQEIFTMSLSTNNDQEKLILAINKSNKIANKLLEHSDLVTPKLIQIYGTELIQIEYKNDARDVYRMNKQLFIQIDEHRSECNKIQQISNQHTFAQKIFYSVHNLIRTNNSFELDNQFIEKYKLDLSKEFAYRYQLARTSNEAGLINIAFKHLEKAYQIYKANDLNHINPTLTSTIVMAYICLLSKFDHSEMIKTLNIEKKYLSNYFNINNYSFLNHLTIGEKFIGDIIDGQFVCIESIAKNEYNDHNISDINYDNELIPLEYKKNKSVQNNSTIKLGLLKNNFNVTFTLINNYVLNDTIPTHCKYFILVNLLSYSSVGIENPDKVLTYYQNLIQKHPYLDNKCQIALKYYEFKLYMQCGKIDEAYPLLLNLPNTGIIYELKYIKSAGELYVYTLIDNEQYEKAQKYIEDHYVGDIHEKSKLNILIKILQEQKLKAEQAQLQGQTIIEEEENNSADESEIKDIVSLMEIAVDEEDFTAIQKNNINNDRIYHQAIHTYHQQRKFQLAKNSFEVDSSVKTWKIKDQIISSKSAVKVESKSNFYVKIDSSIADELDPNILSKLIHAIEKGFVSRKCNEIGMKQIGNLIELVILGSNGDTRLYTQKLFKNTHGDTLIIFDQKGDHATIKRVANNKATLKTISVECASLKDIKDSELESTEHGNDSMINDDHHHSNDDEDVVITGSDE